MYVPALRLIISGFEETVFGFDAVLLPIVPAVVPFVKREGFLNVLELADRLPERFITGLDMVLPPVEPIAPLRLIPFVLLIEEDDVFNPLANLLLST